MVDALAGIGAVVSTQLLSRAVTFLLNVLIARLAAPSAYGTSYVSLQLFSNLSLFITKEGFRKVALRVPDGETEAPMASSINLGWGGALTAGCVSVPLAAYWCYKVPADAPATYYIAIALMATASILEALAEPLVIAALAAFDFQSRALGEGIAMLVRTIAMLLLAVTTEDLPLAFSFSQLIYASIWVAWFARRWAAGTPTLWPSRLTGGQLLHASHLALLGEFSGKVLLKLALTEGEKFLLLALFTEKDWGVFGLVSNLGSIILRLLFAPTEEIAYSAFTSGAAKWSLLRALLLIQGGVGWLGLCYGPGFSRLVVRVLYGHVWASSQAPSVLAAYCVLLFFMALNGIMEAFVDARCSPAWVRLSSWLHLLISLALVLVAWAGSSSGPVALVWANCLAMLLRVLLCAVFAQRHLELTWSSLRVYPIAKLFGLTALCGYGCSIVVPRVEEQVPWLQAGAAVSLALLSIAGTAFLCRHELRRTYSEVREQKKAA